MQGEGSKLRERVFSKFADCNPSAMWKNTACRIESLSSALSKPYTSSPKTLSHETMRVSPQEWGVDEVCAWLQEEGLHEFVAIARDHIITGAVLLSIQEEDLRVDPLASALKVLALRSCRASAEELVCEQEARVDKFGRVRQFVLSIRELVDQHRQTLNLLHDQPQDRRSKSATSAFVASLYKHPPLPDVVLDNIPVIPGAFEASEVCIILLASIFALTCIFHIASTFGSTLQGTRTCGDYMFSGHTAMLTILNRFVCAYSPRTWTPLHTFSAVLNGFGMFCILAAHEHYTLDVFMGFYIATRTFQSYHTVAHAVGDMGGDDGKMASERARCFGQRGSREHKEMVSHGLLPGRKLLRSLSSPKPPPAPP
ncbi:hypothetical protein GUITHDRAFT_136144 [Guillardia theta CCMP2712]|uniref:SAM domain-containing protein n=1 Tax=Guillardia theta (strain CCMP2712) TaxID=905079 RepID=L1JM47_GUITC|nr:hypothetical protein GUITHDRAFT_136144 [Guillardia theta CCMP2712]EKX49487.1 hypothetical protein GUITHDRAFT_136144 [Guillardia theta CCMP2712]|eukprot:XP_005836467.1 hypothetical protein GUITHDRAFT_136144 [Guillardia theta CCMP2712]